MLTFFKVDQNFADFFENKISNLLANVVIDPGVYNGTRKLQLSQNTNFMTSTNIRKAIKSIKMKNAKGDDRIPQRVLIDVTSFFNIS